MAIRSGLSIRYFATNRNRENLGRNLERDKRIQLQMGGYHWLDMRKYMSHYLAKTDPEDMPETVLVKKSGEEVFECFLAKPAIKRVIIVVHGFNVYLHAALTSFTILSDTLRNTANFKDTLILDPTSETSDRLDDRSESLTAVVGFSWPSDGKLLSYWSDRTEAVASTSALANLISRIHAWNPDAKVDIIAHSMGNFLVCAMLQKLVDREFITLNSPLNPGTDSKVDSVFDSRLARRPRDPQSGHDQEKAHYFLDHLIMLAPDVERRHVTQCDVDESMNTPAEYLGPFYAGLYHLVQNVHLFYSRFDSALMASNVDKSIQKNPVVSIAQSFNPDEQLLQPIVTDKRWEQRLGLGPAPELAPPNLTSHNAVTLTHRNIDHGDYMDAQPIVDRIAEMLEL